VALDRERVDATLGVLLKHQEDIGRVASEAPLQASAGN
jgi:hypothetical protein